MSKSRIRTLLLLKLILPIQLMRAIRHERAKMGHDLHEDIPNPIDNRKVLLSLQQRVPQARVDSDDLVDVPEHLGEEVGAPFLGYDILVSEFVDPVLSDATCVSTRENDEKSCKWE